VWLAAGSEAFYLVGEFELGGERAEAVFGAEFEVAGQAEGIDEPGGGDGRMAAVQQPPVHADVVAHDNSPVYAIGQFGPDLGRSWGGGQDGGGQAR
jgi:hypothetical protein